MARLGVAHLRVVDEGPWTISTPGQNTSATELCEVSCAPLESPVFIELEGPEVRNDGFVPLAGFSQVGWEARPSEEFFDPDGMPYCEPVFVGAELP